MDEDKQIALQQLKFLGEHRPAIINEYLNNASKDGYVFITADEYFKAVEPPRFINRETDKREYINFLEKQHQTGEHPSLHLTEQDMSWVYYEVNWQYSYNSWHLKEAVKRS